MTRREWLEKALSLPLSAVAAAMIQAMGCAGKGRSIRLSSREQELLFRNVTSLPVVQWKISSPDRSSVLRRKAVEAGSLPLSARRRLVALMQETLRRSGGVGLAAPQVGISRRVALVELQDKSKKVIECIDPRIVSASAAMVPGYEACLSVSGVGGKVMRHQRVEVAFRDLQGKSIVRRSVGWEARIFQHELDHLDGVLYLDRLKGRLLPLDEVRRLRRQEKEKEKGGPGEKERSEAGVGRGDDAFVSLMSPDWVL